MKHGSASKRLRRRFTVIIAIYIASVLLVWTVFNSIVSSHVSSLASGSMAMAKQNLLTTLDDELSRMSITASVIAGSPHVQSFLTESSVASYYEKAETVAEIIRRSTYPHLDADSIVTITADGIAYRFTGGISMEALDDVYRLLILDGAPLYSAIILDGTKHFCLITPVIKDGVPVGYVVTLSNADKVRRTLMETENVQGIDAAVVTGDVVLLSNNPELEWEQMSVFDRLYGAVTVSRVTGTSLYAVAAITKDALEFSERLYFTASLALLAILLTTTVFLYRFLATKTVDPMLKKADNLQMGLFRTQIDAHFVVNTIEAIESLSAQNRNRDAAAAAKNLAQMIQMLHKAGEEMNIFDQIDNLNNYIEIMEIRSGKGFSVDIDVDDRLIDYRMPMQVLQPLVENAIMHGLWNIDGERLLSIRGIAGDDSIIFEVSDNGKGASFEAIKKLTEMLEMAETWEYPESKLTGVALMNIQKRLQTRYGERYGISVKSSPDSKGFVTTVHLPYIKDVKGTASQGQPAPQPST